MQVILKQVPIYKLIAVLLVGGAIKTYYSAAGVNDLVWVLAPTRFLVELTTGERFTFESYSGYMNRDHSFLIAASCSGVNFLITAFLMLGIGKLWRCRNAKISWSFLPFSLLAAYITTIAANTVRISTALFILREDPGLIWASPEQIHRFEGIVIYFGFLLLLFILSDTLNSQDRPGVGLMRRSLLPLAIYYATTLGIPLANIVLRGGQASSDLMQHSLFVVITPLVLLLPLAIVDLFRGPRAACSLRRIG